MCGLNGIFAYHSAANAVNEAELLCTRDHMRARGPDGAGLWRHEDGRVGFGHRRLAIIDLSDRALQPMQMPADGLTIVFNGEIYNFPELKAELEAAGRVFRTTSDTEALLHLYALHGRDMVHRLRGMFAFAIWDERRKGLFLARDPYGIKPLYYSDHSGTFRFASQVKALRAGRAIPNDLEPAAIVGFQLWGSVPEPFTLYRHVRALPAGASLWVDAAGVSAPLAFARLADAISTGRANPAPSSEVEQRIAHAAFASVRAHLLADVEVGVFLSAGVDSGALLGLMRDAGQKQIQAITLAFDEFKNTSEDEAPLAAELARLYGAEHVVRRINASEFKADLPLILSAMDQPSIDGVNTWFVAKATREVGLKVALSGVGGDELLAGYESFHQIPRLVRWAAPAASLGLGPLVRQLVWTAGLARRSPKLAGVLEYGGDFPGAYLLRRALFLPFELGEIIEPATLEEGLETLDPLGRLRREALQPDPRSDVARVASLESVQYLRNQLLRDTDWAGMAHSLEIRTPLVDFSLLREVAPTFDQLDARRGKLALANAPSVRLPQSVWGREKTGFGVPTARWRGGGASAKGLTSRRWSREVLDSALVESSAHEVFLQSA